MVSWGYLPLPPPGPGSRFCRWRLARCRGHQGRHLRHVEVVLAVQGFPPPSALSRRALPARALPRCRLSLFYSTGQLLQGRGRGRGYVFPGDISDGQYGAVGGEHSHAVTRVVNAGSYVVAVLCLRLQLIVYLYSADGWLEERPHHTTSHRGTCPQTLLWLRGGSGRDTPKTPLQLTKTGRQVRPGTVLVLGCARQGQCR